MSSGAPDQRGHSRRSSVRVRCAFALAVTFAPLCVSAGEVNWESDWQTAFKRAKAEQKLVLVEFFAEWCRPCRTMEQEVFPREEVQRRLAEFVLLRVDFDRQKGRFGVRGIPAFLFFDPDERLHDRVLGAHQPGAFAQKLDAIRVKSPDLLAAARLLGNPDTAASGHLLLGRTYLRAGALRDAAAEFDAASKEAARRGDSDTAAFAEMDGLYVASLASPRKSRALAKLGARGAGESASVRAYRHLIIGRIHLDAEDHARAREAFVEAVTAAAGDDAIRREAQLALANLPLKTRRTP